MKLKFWAFTLLLFFYESDAAFSQLTLAPGYIINTAGDTLPGRLEYVNINLSAKRAFISNTSGELEFLKAEQIKQLYIEPEIYFKTLPFKGKKVFMKVISEGQLDLYEYNGDLVITSNTDSLILLTGGKKTVEKDGKKYAIYDYSYKGQLRKNINTTAFDVQIGRLPFENKKLMRFARELNQQSLAKTKTQLFNQHQFGGQLGVARTSFNIRKSNYQGGGMHSKQKLFENDIYFEKESVITLSAGIYYRRKAGKKYAYLKAGLVYEKAIPKTKTQTKNLYRSFLLGVNKDEPYGQVGYMTDRYHYNFAAISIPLSYFGELSAGRLRPYADLGINTRVYTLRDLTLHREVYLENALFSAEDTKLKIKPITIGPKLDFGCRYLLSNATSVAAGLHFDAAFSKNLVNPNDFKTNTTMLYIAFGF